MSELFDSPPAAPTAAPGPERLGPAVGVLVVLVAGSSLLDDTGLLRHPWWVALALGAAALALALVARTIRTLLR